MSCCKGPGYSSPQDAIKADAEKLLYTICIYTGTDIKKPDYLATIDVDQTSESYGRVIHRTELGEGGDELHHMGWNACSSCNDDENMNRKYLILPGVRSGNFYIVDTYSDPRKPILFKTISGKDIADKTNLSAPHTVHCLGSDIIVSMMGDAEGEAPGGFLHISKDFEIVGRWENEIKGMKYNYDFWYQPRLNMMVSSEWASPNTFNMGFDLEDVPKGKYGNTIHFWDFKHKKIIRNVSLGDEGHIPLEVRFHHEPTSSHGFVGAALSSNIFHWYKENESAGPENVKVEKVIDVEDVIDLSKRELFPVPMPGLITDILISMDDRYLYFSNWLHGDVRQYDIRDPSNPKLTGQIWLGGLLGKAPLVNKVPICGGPQMIQLSLDGRRLYVTTSLYSSWDNQFYSGMKDTGGAMVMIDCDVENGGMKVRDGFLINFGDEPHGASRAHETRYPGGDCSSDIWL
eukprot:GHVN01002418.1.p1 GENE.GHVN01002418.1~~GHVN01002418.1.p1  ORF type:complete len:459 (+),score=69.34 GHVN01002418.1:2053-3429(+)